MAEFTVKGAIIGSALGTAVMLSSGHVDLGGIDILHGMAAGTLGGSMFSLGFVLLHIVNFVYDWFCDNYIEDSQITGVVMDDQINVTVPLYTPNKE
jgi:hypothetical protein